MKVIKEALLGKVSRLFKHGADAIQRFNTNSYLQWLGEARKVGNMASNTCPVLQGLRDSLCTKLSEQRTR